MLVGPVEAPGLSSWRLAAMLAFLVAGCATTRGPEPGAELIGTTLRMQTAAGERTTLRFRDRRTVRAEFRGHSVDGRWRVRDRRLCFYWHGAPRECWPYREPFRRGRTLSVTSDRGNVVRVTMR